MTRDEREKVVGRHILKRIGVGQIEKLVPLWTDCSRPPLTFQMIKLKCFDSRNSREDVMMNRWQNWKLKSKTTIITYPEIWFLELPAAIFLRPLLWLTPATLNLNTYSEGGMASEVEQLHLQLICTVYAHHEARFSSRRPFLERSIQ